MKSIFSDLSLAESDSPPTGALLADDFASSGILGPIPSSSSMAQPPAHAPAAAPASVPLAGMSAPSPTPAFAPAPIKAAQPEEDPIAVMRKIFMGSQVDETNARIARLEQQIADMRVVMAQKVQEIERALREDISRVSKAAADALQAQSDTLTHDIEQAQTTIVSTMDERIRKLSAASVPRTHLAEILRDLSSRLQPSAI